ALLLRAKWSNRAARSGNGRAWCRKSRWWRVGHGSRMESEYPQDSGFRAPARVAAWWRFGRSAPTVMLVLVATFAVLGERSAASRADAASVSALTAPTADAALRTYVRSTAPHAVFPNAQ